MYPTVNVRYKVVDGIIVVLDIRAGEYVILNRVATAMWNALIGISDPKERVSRLQEHFDVSAKQLETDLTAFAQNCVDRGFLQATACVDTERRSRPAARRAGLAFSAWWSLLATTYRLSWWGFGSTYQSYLDLPKPEVDNMMQLEELVSRTECAFLRAENFFPLRSAPQDCLLRSLALYQFSLSAGLPSRHCIGVKRFPFEAHAWVECGGRPLLDAPEYISTFSVLARM